MLAAVGKRTEIFARFSRVAGEPGYAENPRDPREFSVKHRFLADGGQHDLTDEEFGGVDPDHHRRDLRDAIARGDLPSWTSSIQVMPFADAVGYRFNPSNLVPGLGLSRDRMLQGWIFSHHDAHLHRIGKNYRQLPVNAPKAPVNSCTKDGNMTFSCPVGRPGGGALRQHRPRAGRCGRESETAGQA